MRFIIDGYNLIFSRRRPGRPLQPVNVEAARSALLATLARYKAATGDALTVFFDGSSDGSGFLRRQRVRGIEVFFSYPGVTADEEIKAHLESTRGRTGLHVVSSDNSLKRFAKRLGVAVVDSQTFFSHVRRALARKHEAVRDEEPREKYEGPSAADREYWLKLFSALPPKEAKPT
jgi:predicted RNA-binding protein with PIN domain